MSENKLRANGKKWSEKIFSGLRASYEPSISSPMHLKRPPFPPPFGLRAVHPLSPLEQSGGYGQE